MVRSSFAVLALLLALPATAGAAQYRFKVALELNQAVQWEMTFRDIDCMSNSNADYYLHSGSGSGLLRAKLTNGRVTFKTVRGRLVPARIVARPAEERPDLIGAPAATSASSRWTVTYKDDPSNDCEPRPELGRPSNGGSCDSPAGDDSYIPGVLAAYLYPRGGGLMPIGGFYPLDNDVFRCDDPSAITGTAAKAGRSSRGGVAALITDRKVKRITLKASKRGKFKLGDLATAGASFEPLTSAGDWVANWTLTLTRLKS